MAGEEGPGEEEQGNVEVVGEVFGGEAGVEADASEVGKQRAREVNGGDEREVGDKSEGDF